MRNPSKLEVHAMFGAMILCLAGLVGCLVAMVYILWNLPW